MNTINGRFDIRREPQSPLDLGGGAQAMHIRVDKRFEGPLEAVGVVHMIAVDTPVEGSAAYVAVERVEGQLEGHAGSFLLRHCGTTDRGAPWMDLQVIPDSGEDGLLGISGSMRVETVGHEHHYTFEYSLPGL
jgi:hypothetical protein